MTGVSEYYDGLPGLWECPDDPVDEERDEREADARSAGNAGSDHEVK